MKPTRNNEYCLNCDTELKGSYCHQCGQKDLPKRQTLWELVENYIGSTFSFESKFFRSVVWMLFRPGYLPAEYISGRRERYYHPVRAYAFISLVFFFLLFDLKPDEAKKPIVSGSDFQGLWEGVYSGTSLNRYKNVKAYDSIQASLPDADQDGWVSSSLIRNSLRLMEQYKTDGGWKAFQQDLGSAMEGNYPKVFFLMLPLVALFLHLLYIRRDFLYSEHLVFTLYYYNFVYLMASLVIVAGLLPWGGNIVFVGRCWMVLYLPLAMRRMYRQGWGKVWWKCLTLIVLTLTLLVMGSLANIAFSMVNL